MPFVLMSDTLGFNAHVFCYYIDIDIDIDVKEGNNFALNVILREIVFYFI